MPSRRRRLKARQGGPRLNQAQSNCRSRGNSRASPSCAKQTHQLSWVAALRVLAKVDSRKARAARCPAHQPQRRRQPRARASTRACAQCSAATPTRISSSRLARARSSTPRKEARATPARTARTRRARTPYRCRRPPASSAASARLASTSPPPAPPPAARARDPSPHPPSRTVPPSLLPPAAHATPARNGRGAGSDVSRFGFDKVFGMDSTQDSVRRRPPASHTRARCRARRRQHAR